MQSGMRISGTGCCISGCNSRYANTDRNVKFYNFPKKPHDRERCLKWIESIKESGNQPESWQPMKNSRICSKHFVNNVKSNHPASPSYVPNIFPKRKPQPQARWSANQTNALIEEYKKCPFLCELEGKTGQEKESVLGRVAKALQAVRPGVTELEVLHKWELLKGKYTEARQKYHDSVQSGAKEIEVPNLWCYNRMEFLNEHLYSRQSLANSEGERALGYPLVEDCSSEIETNIVSSSDIWSNSSSLANDPLSSDAVKEEVADQIEDPSVIYSVDDAVVQDQSQLDRHEADIFGEFVATQLKKINSHETRQNTILEIHQILHKALTRK